MDCILSSEGYLIIYSLWLTSPDILSFLPSQRFSKEGEKGIKIPVIQMRKLGLKVIKKVAQGLMYC